MQKLGRPLNQLANLKEEYLHQLNKLWITTIEGVAGIIRLHEIGHLERDEMISLFASEFGVTNRQADREIVQIVRKSIPDSEWYAMAGLEQPLSFGLLFDEENQSVMLQSSGTPETPNHLPSQVNLLERFPHRFSGIRNQGLRGTCVAFAVTALHEYMHSQTQISSRLSEEFRNYLGPLRFTQKKEGEDDHTESPAKLAREEDLVCAR
jgi:hypothetical protein